MWVTVSVAPQANKLLSALVRFKFELQQLCEV